MTRACACVESPLSTVGARRASLRRSTGPLHGAQVDYGAFTASLLRRLSPRVTALIKSTWARFEVTACVARPRSIGPEGS